MGCFNVAGTVSGLSIGSGDEVVFFPLLPSQISNGYIGDSADNIVISPCSMLVMSNGVTEYLRPNFLPIFGEYNEYGSIENIVRDANVEYIEEYFGVTIEKFLEVVTRGWCEDLSECVEDVKKREELQAMFGMFEHKEVYEKLVEYSKVNKYTRVSMKNLESYLRVRDHVESTGDRIDIQLISYRRPELIGSHFEYWKKLDYSFEEPLIDSFIDLRHFEEAMYSVNKYYSPAMNGEQHGNNKASQLLLDVSNGILKKEREKYDE